ncbi:MAG: pyridoxamine 5'-phosphate oxidase family protein [Sulfurimonas sp.]|nr:pyridoxamine 5'-phosphate oxidase family protein [Sulfurimonas sp.]
MNDLERIEEFIVHHHVMSLATWSEDDVSVCSLFYTYDVKSKSFIVASSHETQHIKNILQKKEIAGNILLETKNVAEIKGLQFRGVFVPLEDKRLQLSYFDTFPYAATLQPTLWQIKVHFYKLTDNSLGFGKKIIVDF